MKMTEEEFEAYKKEYFPFDYYVEKTTEMLADKAVDAPIDCLHTSNQFWKEIIEFCLERID